MGIVTALTSWGCYEMLSQDWVHKGHVLAMTPFATAGAQECGGQQGVNQCCHRPHPAGERQLSSFRPTVQVSWGGWSSPRCSGCPHCGPARPMRSLCPVGRLESRLLTLAGERQCELSALPQERPTRGQLLHRCLWRGRGTKMFDFLLRSGKIKRSSRLKKVF